MRLPFALCLFALPLPGFADTIEAQSKVVRVTMYPWGATVVRQVDFTAGAGVHDLIVPDLPLDASPSSLRVTAPDGVVIGAVNLATDRLPVTADIKSPEVQAAEDEIERLEGVLRTRDAEIAAVRLRVDAANEQWTFLRGLGQGKAAEGVAAWTVEDLRALSVMVGEQTLAARQAAHTAEQEAKSLELARKDDVEALDKARQALAALVSEGEEASVLTMAVQTPTEGATSLEVTTYTDNASWQPVYDLRLSRGDTPTLAVERSVTVSQASGEDWTDVDLILSTARPADQSAPSDLFPWLRRIEDPALEKLRRESFDQVAPAPAMSVVRGGMIAEAEPVMETAQIEMMGATVTYRYGSAVDIRDGVEALRLRLDTVEMAPELRAVAVPSRDQTAFLTAEVTNSTNEIILPGEAVLYVDGALVGGWNLPLIATGDSVDMGFGPIDGIRLTRTVPERSQGDRGVISRSNRIDEVALIKVENLTGEDWPLRVIDQVPYSEQEDLTITYTATPPVSEANLDGRRGVLAWDFDLDAGNSREIRLQHSIDWPDGQILR